MQRQLLNSLAHRAQGEPPAGWRDSGQERQETRGHSPSSLGPALHSRRRTVRDARRGLIRAATLLPQSRRAALVQAGGASFSSSPPTAAAAAAASWEKEKKKKKESWAAVAGKSLVSHLPAPLSLPSPPQVRTRQRRQPGLTAQTLSACSGRWLPELDPSGCFLSRHRA